MRKTLSYAPALAVLFLFSGMVVSGSSVFAYDWLIYPHDLTTENLNYFDPMGFDAPGNNGVVLQCEYPTSKSPQPIWWIDMSAPTSENLHGACYSPSCDVYVVGDSGVIFCSGPFWDLVESHTTEKLSSISLSVDYGYGFIVGDNGTILYGEDYPPAWQLYQESPTNQNLYSVCVDSYYRSLNTTWAVGAGGTILDYEDGVWTLYPSSPTSEDLFSVYVSNWSEYPYAWACGANGTILRWDGTTWSRINNIPTTENLNCIWGFSDNPPYSGDAMFCVGAGGTILASEDLGLTWHTETCPVTVDLHGVGGYSAFWVWAVGDDGTILSHGEVLQSIQPQSLGRVKALYYGSDSVSQKQPMSKKLPLNR